MALLNVNVSEVPDVVPLLDPKLWDLKVTQPPQVNEIDTKNGKMTVLDVVLGPVEPDPMNRTVRHRIFFTTERGKIELRRLLKSAGLPTDTQDSDLLTGRTIKATVVHNTVTDKTTGQVSIFANIGKILIPGDAGFTA